jgi:hypothetical protein
MPPSESPREVAPELEPELAGIADPDSPGQTAEIAAVAEDAATAGSHTAPPEGTPPQLASAEEQIWNRAEPMEMGFWRDAEPPDAPADPGRGEEEEGEGRSAGPGKG